MIGIYVEDSKSALVLIYKTIREEILEKIENNIL